MKFKKFRDFLSESLAFLSLDKTMKNEFMNRIELKQDFETAKRLFYVKGSFMLTHIEGEKFELRTPNPIPSDELDNFIDNEINPEMKTMKFRRTNKSKKDILKDNIWVIKASLD